MRTVSLATSDRGSGPSVVLLHGQPGTGASWDPVSRLLESEYRVLAPDRPGYGATPGEALGLADNADAIAELIVERAAAPATVVAHSWSGGVAVLLAVGHRDLVHSLVLVGAACTPDSVNTLDWLLTVPVVGNVMAVAGLAGIGGVFPRIRPWARYAPTGLRPRLETALPDLGVTGSDRGSLGRHRRTFIIEQRALMDELPAVTAALGSVKVPVEVVSGDWDLVVPPRAAVALARALPRAQLTMVPRAGHFVARDAPETLAAVIRRSAGPGSVPDPPVS
jgi:pimeloyl-ACP methyl ester carboxylesterase